MRFGINFFPSFLPEQKSGAQYFAECLNLAERADQLGFASVRIVEHHFKPYGGARPNPIGSPRPPTPARLPQRRRAARAARPARPRGRRARVQPPAEVCRRAGDARLYLEW